MPRNVKTSKADKKADGKELKKDVQEGVLSQYGCPWADGYVGTEDQVRGHILGEHFKERPRGSGTVKEPASPDPDENVTLPKSTFIVMYEKAVGTGPKSDAANPIAVDESLLTQPVPSALAIQQESARSAQLERVRVQAERDALKAQADIEKMSSGGSDAQIEALRREVEQLRQEKFQMGVDLRINALQNATNAQLMEIKNLLTQKRENGSHNSINDEVTRALIAKALGGGDDLEKGLRAISLAKDLASGQPTSELAIRGQLSLEKMRLDSQLERDKAERESSTVSKLMSLGEKATNTVTKVIGEAITNRSPGQPVAPIATASLTREQQVEQLDLLAERVVVARQKLLDEIGAVQPAQAPMGPDPLANQAQTMLAQDPIQRGIMDSMSGPGQIFTGRK